MLLRVCLRATQTSISFDIHSTQNRINLRIVTLSYNGSHTSIWCKQTRVPEDLFIDSSSIKYGWVVCEWAIHWPYAPILSRSTRRTRSWYSSFHCEGWFRWQRTADNPNWFAKNYDIVCKESRHHLCTLICCSTIAGRLEPSGHDIWYTWRPASLLGPTQNDSFV
jgi:hypothetical protein